MSDALLNYARETLEIEIEEARRLLTRLDDNFLCACRLLLNCSRQSRHFRYGKIRSYR